MNSLQVIVCLGVLAAMAVAAPQGNFGDSSPSNVAQDSEAVRSALELTPIILEAFSGFSNQGDFRSMSPEDSNNALLRIMDASRKTLDESQSRGFDVPAGARQRLDAAQSILPATFKFFEQLRTIGANSNFDATNF